MFILDNSSIMQTTGRFDVANFSTSVLVLWGSIAMMYATYDPVQLEFVENPATFIFYSALAVYVFAGMLIIRNVNNSQTTNTPQATLALAAFVISALAIVTQGYSYSMLDENRSMFFILLILHLLSSVYLDFVINSSIPPRIQMEQENRVVHTLTTNMQQASRDLQGRPLTVSNIGEGFYVGTRAVQAQSYGVGDILSTGFYALFYLLSFFFSSVSYLLPFFSVINNIPQGYATLFGAMTGSYGSSMLTSSLVSWIGGILLSTAVAVPIRELYQTVKTAMNSTLFATLTNNIMNWLNALTEPFWSSDLREYKRQERETIQAELDKLREQEAEKRRQETLQQSFLGGFSCKFVVCAMMTVAMLMFTFTETLNTNNVRVNGVFNLVLLMSMFTAGYFVDQVTGGDCEQSETCKNLLMTWTACAAVYKVVSMLSVLGAPRGARVSTNIYPLLLFIVQSGVLLFLYYGACVSDQIPESSVYHETRAYDVDTVTKYTLNIFFILVLFLVFGNTLSCLIVN